MRAGERFTVDDVEYEAHRFYLLRCANCKRQTTTGLCGCEQADPVRAGYTLVGMPVGRADYPTWVSGRAAGSNA